MSKAKKTPKVLSRKEISKKFVDSMKKVGKIFDKNPSEVSAAEFYANDPNELTEWSIRSSGGFENMKKMYFHQDNDPVADTASKLIAAHRKKLDNQYGNRIFTMEEVSRDIQNAIKNTKFHIHKPVAQAPKSSSKKSRTILAHLSDSHFGANIDGPEMGGVNTFNWLIASRRLAAFAQQIANYKRAYRKETNLALCINGDIIAGMIHNQEWFVDLLTVQHVGTMSLLVQLVSYLATQFDEVDVYCTPGNHGRMMHKSGHQRATTHKYDSHENIIYHSVKAALASCKNVKMHIPMAPFAIVKAQGHQFFVTHGDTIINVGNPGNSLNMRSISAQVNKLNVSDIGGTTKFAAILAGHVHTPTVQLMENGCMLIINGCLSGLDPYAQSISIFESHPTQQLFEITPTHAVGDIRLIQVKSADKDESLDKIIKPFRREDINVE
jgi:predicted phosphodiesterase